MLDGANSTKFLTCWVSLQSSHANFQNIFVSPNIADILNFRIFAKHKNAYILKTMLDRADCADFGCHNSIRLETKHFLNTLALTFISFSGRSFSFFCERSSSFYFTFCLSRDLIFMVEKGFFLHRLLLSGYLGFSMVVPLPFVHDNLKNILLRPFKFGMWVYVGNATNAIVL